MPPQKKEVLEIYAFGRLTVVGFGGYDSLDHVNVIALRDEVTHLIEQHNVEVLAFDLTGVTLVPSGMLGLIASLKELNIQVQLFNPSPDIREVLQITKLDQIIDVHDLDL